MHKRLLTIILLFFAAFSWSQESQRQILKGKLKAEVSDLEGIYIVNLQTEKVSISGPGGYFHIMAKAADTLMFSAVQFKGKSIGLTAADFEKEMYFVTLESMINQLDEVTIIRYNNINAVALGIIPRGQKKYTPAERRLKTASSLDGQFGLNSVMSIDPLLNYLSGRTAMLKKELQVEKKEFALRKISDMFQHEYFTKQLQIPEIYVDGFCFYLVEDKKFVEAVNAKNKTMAAFLMGELAVKYNEMIAGNK